MSRYFLQDTCLAALEREMQQVPGFDAGRKGCSGQGGRDRHSDSGPLVKGCHKGSRILKNGKDGETG